MLVVCERAGQRSHVELALIRRVSWKEFSVFVS